MLLPLPRIRLAIRGRIASGCAAELIGRSPVGVWRAAAVLRIVLPIAIPAADVGTVATINVRVAIKVVIVVDIDVVVAAPSAVVAPAPRPHRTHGYSNTE